jgi:quinol monooxygenase YgiN
MYGLINRFVAHPGQREALVAAMTSDVGVLPGCRSFMVAHDFTDLDVVWVTEVWDSKAAWEASMEIEAVKASIEVAVPLVKDWGKTVETKVVARLGT